MNDIQREGNLDDLQDLFDDFNDDETDDDDDARQPDTTQPSDSGATMYQGQSNIPIPPNRILQGTHPAQLSYAARRPDDRDEETDDVDDDLDAFLQNTNEEQFLALADEGPSGMNIEELPDTHQAIANSLSDQQQAPQPFAARPTIVNVPEMRTMTRQPTEEVDEHMDEVEQHLTLPAYGRSG